MDERPLSATPERRFRRWIARHRGAIALSISVAGFAATEMIVTLDPLPFEKSLTLLRALFEGALVGSIADWFAVTALFRKIPIPLLSRHTNLLARRRAAMVNGIVDMAQTQWLSPQAVREYLTRISCSQLLAERVLSEHGRQQLRAWTRKGLGVIIQHLDHPNVVMLLEHILKRNLRRWPAPKRMTPFILRLMRDRTLETQVYAKLARLCATLRDDAELLRSVQHMILEHIRASASESRWMRTKLWLGKQFIEGDDDADKVEHLLQQGLAALAQQLSEMEQQIHHPMRLALRRQVKLAARRYDQSEGGQEDLFERLKTLFLDIWVQKDTAEHVLKHAKIGLQKLLEEDARWLGTLDAFIYQQMSALLTSSPYRVRLDAYISAQLSDMVESNPQFVGEIVRESLSTTKLPTQQLIDQIEDKVGQDLQWIRVNGAVVGGLVAVTITGLRMAWGA